MSRKKLAACLLNISEGRNTALVEQIAKLDVQSTQLKIGASVGAAIFPDDADTTYRLQRLADDAMYKAKKAGKNRVRMVNPRR